jgi:hypothetical protein
MKLCDSYRGGKSGRINDRETGEAKLSANSAFFTVTPRHYHFLIAWLAWQLIRERSSHGWIAICSCRDLDCHVSLVTLVFRVREVPHDKLLNSELMDAPARSRSPLQSSNLRILAARISLNKPATRLKVRVSSRDAHIRYEGHVHERDSSNAKDPERGKGR